MRTMITLISSDKGFTLFKSRKRQQQILSSKYSIVVMREYNISRNLLDTVIQLRQAPGLCDLLQTIYEGNDYMGLDNVPPEVSAAAEIWTRLYLTLTSIDFAPRPLPCQQKAQGTCRES